MTILTRDEILNDMMKMIDDHVEEDVKSGAITEANRESRKLFYMGGVGGMMGSPMTKAVFKASKKLQKEENKKAKK
jgi:hypothetical protein